MTPLTTIIERLSAAEEGSRELDALIWCALNGKRYKGHHVPYSGYGENPRTQVEFTEPPKRTRQVTNDHSFHKHAEPVTTDLTAAVALCERLLPDSEWTICKQNDNGCIASVYTADGRHLVGFTMARPTPALALCIAVLRAHQQE